MEKMKRVFIKIEDNGNISILVKDPDVAVLVQYPDTAETEMYQGDTKIWENRQDDGISSGSAG